MARKEDSGKRNDGEVEVHIRRGDVQAKLNLDPEAVAACLKENQKVSISFREIGSTHLGDLPNASVIVN
jgi:hypothetical protein